MIDMQRPQWGNLEKDADSQLLRRLMIGHVGMLVMALLAGAALASAIMARPGDELLRSVDELLWWQYGLVFCYIIVAIVFLLLGFIRIVREIERRLLTRPDR